MEKGGDGGSNTGTPPSPAPSDPKRAVQAHFWSWTLNNYEMEQMEQMEHLLRHECEWFVFQEEVGENGTPHLQGTMKLRVKQRMTQLKKLNPKIHWEATRSVSASLAYCQKEKTRSGRQVVYGIEIPEPLEIDEPYGWQLQVVDILKTKPDKRTIHWFWEPKGNVGKTTLCKYLVVKHNALMLTGKSTDMFHMLAKNPTKRTLVIVDVPRSSAGYVNYGAIEQIKNGLVFSGKYEGAQLVFNSPHVIAFANSAPDLKEMSSDRWHIVQIV